MSNLNGIPSADYFETTLANTWNGTTGTVYVNAVPSASMPVGEYSYIVVNPGEVNMQVAKVDGWDSDNITFNVTDVAVPKGAGTYYNATNHPVGSVVRFSNNYAFWKDIQEAINGKIDAGGLAPVALSNDYNDLCNKPTIPTDNCELCNSCGYTTCTGTVTNADLSSYMQCCDLGGANLILQKNGTTIDCFNANATTDKCINIVVPTQACDICAMPDNIKYGTSLDLNINNSTYVITSQLKDQNGCNLGCACTIDLPLESVVVDGCYNCGTKEIELTLESGSTICFSVADLVSGLQSEITCDNKLSSDLVDDTCYTNKFVTSTEKCCINSALQPGDLACYAQCCDIPSVSGFVQESCVACINGCCLTQGGNICICGGGGGSGDMLASTYDPCNCNGDAFDYCKFHNTPDLNCYVTGAASSTDGNIAIFDGVTGKIVKDSGRGIETYVLSEGDWCKTTTATKGVSPYNTSYCYTNIEICDNIGVERKEGAQYVFNVDTQTVGSSYRNIRVRIGSSGNYIPLMGSSGTILGGCSYWSKCTTRPYYYSTKYQACGALHLYQDTNTTYTAMTSAVATTGTCTTSMTIASCVLKCAIDNCISCRAQCCDIPTDNCQLSNGCGYTTCTGTLQSCDIACINGCCLTSGGNVCLDGLPSQTGCCGKFLTTDGSAASWADAPQNVKVFTLSDTSDLVNAQAAYDWYANGGNPIIKITGDNGYYCLQSASSSNLFFTMVVLNTASDIFTRGVIFTLSSGTVTTVNKYIKNIYVVSSLPATPDANTIYFVTS